MIGDVGSYTTTYQGENKCTLSFKTRSGIVYKEGTAEEIDAHLNALQLSINKPVSKDTPIEIPQSTQ
jgi:hypothetical protein